MLPEVPPGVRRWLERPIPVYESVCSEERPLMSSTDAPAENAGDTKDKPGWLSLISPVLLALANSPQVQSLERTALKSLGTLLIAHGFTMGQSSAILSIVGGFVALGVGLIGSGRANSAAGLAASSAANPAPAAVVPSSPAGVV